MAEKTKEEKDREVLSVALEQFRTLQAESTDNRASALEDLKFTYNIDNGQWDDNIRTDRENDHRPCLTHNKTHKFVKQVSNRERSERKTMKVVPVDDVADIATAKVINGMLEQIQHQSKADKVFSEAGEKALAGGFGYWRILTKYADDSFEQDIIIKLIENQFSVYKDPRNKYAFIREGMLRSEFEEMYPDSISADFDGTGIGEDYELWYEDDKVFISEYFKKEPYEKEIAQLARQDTPGITQVQELDKDVTREKLEKDGYTIIRTRKFNSYKVMWRKITGHDILEEKEWVGDEIPIIECKGEEVNIAGKIYKRSLIREGKDPQIMYNYWLSNLTEKVGLVPKSPYILTTDMIKGHVAMWNDANVKNYPYLLVNSTSEGMPKREQGASIDTGSMGMINIANNDIKDTLGMYESFVGEVSNERSGKAINARSQRSDMGTFHFSDNQAYAIMETCRQIVKIIPKVFDTERVVRVIGEDGNEATEVINKAIVAPDGTKYIYDLSAGKYDVREGIKAWGTRRQEAAQGMTEAMQYAGDYAPAILPLLFKFQDWPGADELEEGIRQIQEAQAQQPAKGEGGG